MIASAQLPLLFARQNYCGAAATGPHFTGDGWLIFALPPAEVAVHPAEENGRHELYFMCDDLNAEIPAPGKKGVRCSEAKEARWGSMTTIPLPGGGEVGLNQPKHPTAQA